MITSLVILENDDVAAEQNLAEVTRGLIDSAVATIIFEPITGFPGKLPDGAVGLIVGGGLPSVNDARRWIDDEVALVRKSAQAGIPTLGICFGHQLIAKAFGRQVVRRELRVGFAEIEKLADDPLLAGLPERWRAPVYHHDRVEAPPPGFEVIATSDYCAVQAVRHVELPLWSVQFHPEIRFGINERFAAPVAQWDDPTAFDDAPNQRLIDNFVQICLSRVKGMRV